MKLSLCIATYNEEKNIHYPLDSAIGLVDEVIIVDGGSTDKTVEKAKSYGKKVKVFIERNLPMFHINKQRALNLATGDWILQLDADEEISQELKNEIVKLLDGYIANKASNNITIQQSNNSPVAFWIPRKNWFLSRFLTKGGQYPDYTIRLYKNGAVRFPLKNVHENVEVIYKDVIPAKAGIQKRGANYIDSHFHGNDNVGYLKNPILHYADPDFSRYLKRWDRYTSLDAQILAEKSKQWNNGTMKQFWMFLDYFVLKPKLTFFLMYFRHLGFLDGFPGFVFALFSAIRFWAIYIKYWQRIKSS